MVIAIYMVFGFVLIIMMLFFVSVCENKKLDIGSYQIVNKKLPAAFHGCSFVMLSDFHSNTNRAAIIEAVNALEPEFILVGGDMMVGIEHTDYQEAERLILDLAKQFPIYYSMGNHEMKCGLTEFSQYQRKLEAAGVCFLDNEQLYIEKDSEKIGLAGLNLESLYFKKWKKVILKKEHITELLGDNQPDQFTILLAHHPVFFQTYSAWGAALVLSGHLHGGMVRLPWLGGVFSPQIRLFPHYSGGSYRNLETVMVVSRGLGMHTIKLRIGNPPDLVFVTLNRE